MNEKSNQQFSENFDKILDDLAVYHWAMAPRFFSDDFCRALSKECLNLDKQNLFHDASIGRKEKKQVESKIRGDRILWLGDFEASHPMIKLNENLQLLIKELNQNFYLGLRHFEAHLAIYPPNSRYEKHIDNHKGVNSRQITFILYLNEHWTKGDGGELTLFAPETETSVEKELIQITPTFGTFVLFRSELFPHRVDENLKQRLSITGWFRTD